LDLCHRAVLPDNGDFVKKRSILLIELRLMNGARSLTQRRLNRLLKGDFRRSERDPLFGLSGFILFPVPPFERSRMTLRSGYDGMVPSWGVGRKGKRFTRQSAGQEKRQN